jgi:hypothetical protein
MLIPVTAVKAELEPPSTTAAIPPLIVDTEHDDNEDVVLDSIDSERDDHVDLVADSATVPPPGPLPSPTSSMPRLQPIPPASR